MAGDLLGEIASPESGPRLDLVVARVEFVPGDSSTGEESRLRRFWRSDHLLELRSSESHWEIWSAEKSRFDCVSSLWDET